MVEALEDVQRKKKEIEADSFRQPASLPPTTKFVSHSIHPMLFFHQFSTINPVSNHLSDNVPFTMTHPPPSQPTLHVPINNIRFPVTPAPVPPPAIPTKSNISPSYRLPSVRDIYWPTGSQQQYTVPVSGPPMLPTNTLSLPTPIHSTNSSPNSVKENNRSFNNCDSVVVNDLAATFDGNLGSDDPFHEAELKSLNDVAELRHLYSAIGSANTVRR